MLAGFVIFLREGTEASIIIAVLLSYLERSGHRRHFKAVFLGAGIAGLLAAAGGVAAYLTIHTYAGSRAQTIFETATYAVAVIILTYMTFWMRAHAKTISKELSARAESTIGKKERLGLALLAFQAVGREGLETAVFTLAIVFAAGTKQTLLGGLVGLVCALGIAYAIFRAGKRLNLAIFFTTVGTLLIVFAAGLVADIVENLQQLGWVHALSSQMWNSTSVVSESSAIGDVFHSLFGYADRPTALQAVCYVVYVAFAVGLYIAINRRGSSSKARATGDRGDLSAASS
ncbi:MAG: FTR1 family protein [Acidimicrobiales bacterium]